MRLFAKRVTINLIMFSLIALISGGIVYLKMNTVHQRALHQQTHDSDRVLDSYRGHITQLSQYVKSLKSRVQHLSEDNRRLSKAGNAIVANIEEQTAAKVEKKSTLEKLQQDLVDLDSTIIDKYAAYVLKQEDASELKIVCKKGSSKSKKCEEYQHSLTILDSISAQIKYLNTKRDILLSNIERNSAAL